MLPFVKECPENVLLDNRWLKGTEEIFKDSQSHGGANPEFFTWEGRADSEPMYHFVWALLGWCKLFTNFYMIVSTKFVIFNIHLRV